MTSITVLFLSLFLSSSAFADEGPPDPADAIPATPRVTTTTTTTTAAAPPDPAVDCTIVDPCTAAEIAQMRADFEAWKKSHSGVKTLARIVKIEERLAVLEGMHQVQPPTTVVVPPPSATAEATATVVTPPAPAPEYQLEESENPWMLGGYGGMSGRQQGEIEGVTAPGLVAATAGAKVHMDYGEHAFMSVQGGVLGGTDNTLGWEGNLTVGGQVGVVEIGAMFGAYVYDVKGAGQMANPYIKAKGFGQSVGVSLAASPSKRADWLVLTAHVQANPFYGRMVSPHMVKRDFGLGAGLDLTVYGRSRKTVSTVAVAQPAPQHTMPTQSTQSSTTTVQTSGTPSPWHP